MRSPIRLTLLLLLTAASCVLVACGSSSSSAPDGDADSSEADGDSDAESGEADSSAETWAAVDYADPRIGTGGVGYGVGNAVPGAAAPFGLVKVSPDTTVAGGGAATFYHCGGYYSDDDVIQGFSHVHLHGVGANDLGNILFAPVAGPIDDAKILFTGYNATFSHANETVSPGYYRVTYNDPAITTELTATERAAYHRYTFPDGTAPALVIDLGHSVPGSSVVDGEVTIDPAAQTVSGKVRQHGGFTGRFGDLWIYFHAHFKQAFAAYGTFNGHTRTPSGTHDTGAAIGAMLEFAAGAPIEAQVGISYVSADGARANLAAEMTAFDFDAVRQATRTKWDDEMSVVKFAGGTDTQRRIAATALYHTMLMPDLFMDADGQYLGFDQKLHKAEGFRYHTNFSMWDTYRTLHPLFNLIKPERQAELVQSLLAMADQGGYLPKWPMGAGYTNCMNGTPADIVISEAYIKGVRNFDAESAFKHMLDTADGPTVNSSYSGRSGIASYLEHGYVASEDENNTVSLTQEYAIADNAIANFAAALGKTDEAARFATRATNPEKLWYAEKQFFFPRTRAGDFITDFSYTKTIDSGYYTEGDAWQYNWLYPHNPEGLRTLFGGAEAMLTKLSTFFDQAKIDKENEDELTALLPPKYYWQGNEPDIHSAYLFLFTGRPDLTQKWVRWIMDTLYADTPSGITGNDDAGTMSAWYLWSALGLYPLAGTDRYLLGTPRFERAEVKVAGGTLVIEAPGVSDTVFYVTGVTLNGTPLTRAELTHTQLSAGGTLHFTLSDTPSTWGAL